MRDMVMTVILEKVRVSLIDHLNIQGFGLIIGLVVYLLGV